MKKRLRKILLFAVLGLFVFTAAVSIVLCDDDFRRERLVKLLRERGVEASFEELHVGVLFSDSVRARGVVLTFPSGVCLRIEKLSASRNDTLELFSGTLAFRDFSCSGLALDDARGRRLVGFSLDAEEISVAFRPWTSIETFVREKQFPFALSAKNFRARAAGGREIASGDIVGEFHGAEPISLSGKIHGDFAELMAQPCFSKIDNIAAGAFTLEGRGVTAMLSLENLRSRYGEIEIPKIAIFAERGESATGTLAVEIRGERQTSSAKIHFSKLAFGDDMLEFNADAEADTLVAADLARVGLLFRGQRAAPAFPPTKKFPPKKSRAVPEKKIVSDVPAIECETNLDEDFAQIPQTPDVPAKSLWAGVSGYADFRVRRVIFQENEIGEHFGSLSISPEIAALEFSVPKFFDGSARGRFFLAFTANDARYRLAGTLDGNNVELHRFVPALRVREPAPVVGKFDFSAEISSEASAPERLEDAANITFSLKNSSPGRVRIFNANSKKIRRAEKIVRIGGDLVNLLGGITRNLDPRASRLADAFEKIRTALSDVSYSEMRVEGEYRTGGDLRCRRFEMRGDEFRIFGEGGVRPLIDEQSERWPLKFSATPFVRGSLADAMRELGILHNAGTPDADGFFALHRFDYAGTTEQASEKFFETLMDAASGREPRDTEDDARERRREPAENLIDALVR